MSAFSAVVLAVVLAVVAFESTSGRGTGARERARRDVGSCLGAMSSVSASDLPDFGKIFDGGVSEEEMNALCPDVRIAVDCMGSPDYIAFIAHACGDDETDIQNYLDFELCLTTNTIDVLIETNDCLYSLGRETADRPFSRCDLYSHRSGCYYKSIMPYCGENAAIYSPLWYNQSAAQEGLDCRFTQDSMK